MPQARSSGPKNRAKPEEEQPDPTAQEQERQAFELDVRNSAKSGLTYGQVADKHGITLEQVLDIIHPDLVTKVDASTQEPMEQEA